MPCDELEGAVGDCKRGNVYGAWAVGGEVRMYMYICTLSLLTNTSVKRTHAIPAVYKQINLDLELPISISPYTEVPLCVLP